MARTDKGFRSFELIKIEHASGGLTRIVKIRRGEITRIYTNVPAQLFDTLAKFSKTSVWTVIRPYPNNLFGLPTEHHLFWGESEENG